MKESQHAEWKRSWRDEFLKWICGFANADGGVLVIGKDDKGKPVGLSNAEKLLKEIPNKFPFAPQEGKETPVETREKTGVKSGVKSGVHPSWRSDGRSRRRFCRIGGSRSLSWQRS